MNGPLLVSLLPPERIWAPAVATSDSTPFVAVFLLIGYLLSLALSSADCPLPGTHTGATFQKLHRSIKGPNTLSGDNAGEGGMRFPGAPGVRNVRKVCRNLPHPAIRKRSKSLKSMQLSWNVV